MIVSVARGGGVWKSSDGYRLADVADRVFLGESIAFTTDGKRFVLWGPDEEGVITIHDIRTDGMWDTDPAKDVPDDEQRSQGGHCKATTREDGEFRLPVGIALARIQAHAGRVTACAFSVDNTFIVSGGTDDTVKVWAWETATEISSATLNAVPQRTPSSHRAYPRIRKLKFIDEHTVAAAIDDAEILEWNFWSGEHVSTVSWTGTFDEYPRQRRYRAEVRGDEICILDRGTGEDIAWLPAGRDLVSELTLIAHPNGRTWAGMLGDRVFHFVLESYSAA
jgi:WD40 repeat protein